MTPSLEHAVHFAPTCDSARPNQENGYFVLRFLAEAEDLAKDLDDVLDAILRALIDALRDGRARERQMAERELIARLRELLRD